MISLKTRHIAVIVPVAFAAGIGLTMAFNLWKTTNEKVPAAYASGDFAGKANPADIRGSYTFADVVKAFPVPLEDLARAFGVAQNPGAFQVKGLEGSGGLGTDSVRLFVARYAGLPFEPEETTGVTAAAVAILEAKGGLSVEQLADLRARIEGGASAPITAAIPESAKPAQTPAPAPASAAPAASEVASPSATAPAASAAPATPSSPAASTEHATSGEDRTIKGKTTFKELADWGVSEADIRKVFGGDMGATGVALKDYCAQKGIEFTTVKSSLQDLVDAAAP